MSSLASFAERSRIPVVLWPEDVAVVLGLPSTRAAREFLVTHGIPHARLGSRVFLTSETLIAFLREHEERRLTREEARAKADETIQQIAPTAQQRRRGRKPPEVRGN